MQCLTLRRFNLSVALLIALLQISLCDPQLPPARLIRDSHLRVCVCVINNIQTHIPQPCYMIGLRAFES